MGSLFYMAVCRRSRFLSCEALVRCSTPLRGEARRLWGRQSPSLQMQARAAEARRIAIYLSSTAQDKKKSDKQIRRSKHIVPLSPQPLEPAQTIVSVNTPILSCYSPYLPTYPHTTNRGHSKFIMLLILNYIPPGNYVLLGSQF